MDTLKLILENEKKNILLFNNMILDKSTTEYDGDDELIINNMVNYQCKDDNDEHYINYMINLGYI